MIKQILAMVAMLGMLITAPSALAARTGDASPALGATQALDVKADVGKSGDHDSPFPEPIWGPQD